jgi:hypothetical protein
MTAKRLRGAHLSCFDTPATNSKQQKKHRDQAVVQTEDDVAEIEARLPTATA